MRLVIALIILAIIALLLMFWVAKIEAGIKKRNDDRSKAIEQMVSGENYPIHMQASDYINWLELCEAQRV